MSTIFLLMMSNVFMTFAWYGHLKCGHDWPLWKAILISWGIALLEYRLAVVRAGSASGLQGCGDAANFVRRVLARQRRSWH
jgi:uncharacterized protein (DUF486 family)